MNKEKRSRSEEIAYQAEHYDEISLKHSLRGRAIFWVEILILVTSATTLYLFGPVYAVVSLLIYQPTVYLIYKGYKWAFIALIIVVSVAIFHDVYTLLLISDNLLSLLPLVIWWRVCVALSSALGVEQKRKI